MFKAKSGSHAAVWAALAVVVISGGVSCDGASSPSGSSLPISNAANDGAPAECLYTMEDPAPKFAPNLTAAFGQNSGPRLVMILYKKDLAPSALPDNCGRPCPAREAVLAERDRASAAVQRCTVEKIKLMTSEPVEMFSIPVSTAVRLNRDQAFAIASLTDVRQLDDGDDHPPPP